MPRISLGTCRLSCACPPRSYLFLSNFYFRLNLSCLFRCLYESLLSNSSAVSWRAHEAQYRLIEALEGSEQLVTFFPSEYATPHTTEDLTSPYLADNHKKQKVREYCVKHGVPYTVLANATVPELLFNFV